MFYQSTRNSGLQITSSQAISQGISEDGGLFVPCEIPQLTLSEIGGLAGKTYPEQAAFLLGKFLTDFSGEELLDFAGKAYTTPKYESEDIIELSHLYEGTYVLELWHGPTCAFKDMALQILPHLLTASLKKTQLNKKVVILVATSGDTGKAALEGFRDIPGTEIVVFYPEDGVSPMQKRQMTTQEGNNVFVCAIQGNFDDAQSGVKKIFTSPDWKEKLERSGRMFSSANSINWGRLVPQIVYYVSSYARLVETGELSLGEKVNIVVPTGNFGNILAAYYAKQMGLPVGKLICASNSNNVLTDFIQTGVYDRNRPFHTTLSPSMDILISSNLERLLYHLCGKDSQQITKWFDSLASSGRYEVTDTVKNALKQDFYAGWCDDEKTKDTIKEIYQQYSYTCDPHTAVAAAVCKQYKKETGDTAKHIIASTASPYKFSAGVLDAILGQVPEQSEFELVEKLEAVSCYTIPESLKRLRSLPVRFQETISKESLGSYLEKALKIAE